jgi:hypothetical protein
MKGVNDTPAITISEDSSFSAFFNETENDISQEKKKDKQKQEPMEIAVKISLDTKLRLQAILQKRQRESGKFIALNRFINGILNDWIAENE